MRLLIVEDEARLAENIARSLRETAAYAVDVAADGDPSAGGVCGAVTATDLELGFGRA